MERICLKESYRVRCRKLDIAASVTCMVKMLNRSGVLVVFLYRTY